MNQDLVIKLNEIGQPIGVIESPPMLYTNLKTLHPGISWPENVTPSQVEEYGYGAFEWASVPAELPYNQSVQDVGLQKQSDGFWRQTFVTSLASAEQMEIKTNERKEVLRHYVRQMLKDCDYTQYPDARR